MQDKILDILKENRDSYVTIDYILKYVPYSKWAINRGLLKLYKFGFIERIIIRQKHRYFYAYKIKF